MGLATTLASQLAHPRGMGGHLLGKAMDLANRRPTRRAVELLDPQAGEAILDAGCGTGTALARARDAAQCRLVGLDPSSRMLKAARRRLGHGVELHSDPIERQPFAQESFDGILALNVFYFASADGAMPRALYRMLRPGGRLVVYVTERDSMQGWKFTEAGLHRLYDELSLAALLHQGGFEPAKVRIIREKVGGGVVGLFAYATR